MDKGYGHYTNQLSRGQQRVAIAHALSKNPSILLADVPTGNLDSRTSLEGMDIFQKLRQERDITTILITHEMDVAEYGLRIVAFRDGNTGKRKRYGQKQLQWWLQILIEGLGNEEGRSICSGLLYWCGWG